MSGCRFAATANNDSEKGMGEEKEKELISTTPTFQP